MKKSLISFLAVVLISLSGLSQQIDKDINLAAKELCAKLEAFYQSSSTNDLERFLRDWNKTIPSNTVEFIKQNDIVEAIFDIYAVLFKPLDTIYVSGFKKDSDLQVTPFREVLNCKYVAVQNKIYYRIVEKEEKFRELTEMEIRECYGICDSINDFRPPLNFEKVQVLYLLPEYLEAFDMFLGVSMVRGKLNTNPLTSEKDDWSKRDDFIRPYIPINRGHWMAGPEITTTPYVSCIYFDKNITNAIVDFYHRWWGYMAVLKKEANGWTIAEIRLAWMQ